MVQNGTRTLTIFAIPLPPPLWDPGEVQNWLEKYISVLWLHLAVSCQAVYTAYLLDGRWWKCGCVFCMISSKNSSLVVAIRIVLESALQPWAEHSCEDKVSHSPTRFSVDVECVHYFVSAERYLSSYSFLNDICVNYFSGWPVSRVLALQIKCLPSRSCAHDGTRGGRKTTVWIGLSAGQVLSEETRLIAVFWFLGLRASLHF